MTGRERRTATRSLTDWPARCSFDDARTGWHRCRIIDISTGGAALDVDDARPDAALPAPLWLQITSIAGDEAVVEIQASIRRRIRAVNGRLILGITFNPLSRPAQDLLQLMIGLRTRA